MIADAVGSDDSYNNHKSKRSTLTNTNRRYCDLDSLTAIDVRDDASSGSIALDTNSSTVATRLSELQASAAENTAAMMKQMLECYAIEPQTNDTPPPEDTVDGKDTGLHSGTITLTPSDSTVSTREKVTEKVGPLSPAAEVSCLQVTLAEKTATEMKRIVDSYSTREGDYAAAKGSPSRCVPKTLSACLDEVHDKEIEASNPQKFPVILGTVGNDAGSPCRPNHQPSKDESSEIPSLSSSYSDESISSMSQHESELQDRQDELNDLARAIEEMAKAVEELPKVRCETTLEESSTTTNAMMSSGKKKNVQRYETWELLLWFVLPVLISLEVAFRISHSSSTTALL